jgi:hypothetical protein
MIYVMRNEDGKVVGLFALPQPGFAEEHLAEDDPEVVGFLRGGEDKQDDSDS